MDWRVFFVCPSLVVRVLLSESDGLESIQRRIQRLLCFVYAVPGGTVCLYAAHIAIQKLFTFTQADIDDVRIWIVHLMDETG
jgi:hypothetical protein